MIGVDVFFKRFAPWLLEHRGTLLIEGFPGAGKTTLASSICYSYARRDDRCLYITFHEDKEKVFKILKVLGIDFVDVEKKGLLKYVRLPVTLDTDSLIDEISKLITEAKPRVIVLDSVNPLLKAVTKDAAKRAYLQNFFASLPEILNGLVVLTYELPMQGTGVGQEDVEFVADVIVTLKYRISRKLLVRMAEIKKSRGSMLRIAEIPFTIREGMGIRFFVPVVLEHISTLRDGELVVPHPGIGGLLRMRRGEAMFITHPPDARPAEISLLLLALAIANRVRILFLSYKYSPKDLREFFITTLVARGIDEDRARELVDRYVEFRSTNPTSVSLAEIYSWEIENVEKVKPPILVFHGVEVFSYLYANALDEYFSTLYNQLQYLKSLGISVVRISSYTSREFYRLNTSVSDIVHRFFKTKSGALALYTWRRGSKPRVFPPEDVEKCLSSIANYLKSIIGNAQNTLM